MRAIYCGNSEANGGRGHFVARINGPNLEIWSAKCKTFHAVPIAGLVADMADDLRNGHHGKEEGKLLW